MATNISFKDLTSDEKVAELQAQDARIDALIAKIQAQRAAASPEWQAIITSILGPA